MTVADGLNPGVHEYIDSFIMATVDASLASQNATVAAESIGLGTVYIGATRNKAKELAELIQLPSHSYVVCGLVVGWPDPKSNASIRPRLPQNVVAHLNRYNSSDFDAHVKSYEEAFHTFREGLGMKDKTRNRLCKVQQPAWLIWTDVRIFAQLWRSEDSDLSKICTGSCISSPGHA
jgi:hypothetical protein